MLENIKANYVLKTIFDYLENENLNLKLFIHSKLFQKKLGLNLYDYWDNYFSEKLEDTITLKDYFFFQDEDGDLYYPENFDKDLLNKKLKDDSISNDIDIGDL